MSPLVVVPRFAEMKQAVARLAEFRTVALTSAHAVDALVGALRALGHDVRRLAGLRLCAVGEGTGARLERYGLGADLMASGGGAALARAILDTAELTPDPILYPRALDGRPELVDLLRAAGRQVEVVAAYETHPDRAALKQARTRHLAEPYAAIGFASPRGAAALIEVFGGPGRLAPAIIGAIGETTRAALAEAGLPDALVPETPSLAALVELLSAEISNRPPESLAESPAGSLEGAPPGSPKDP